MLAQQVTSLRAGWAQSCLAHLLVAALAAVGVPVAPELLKAPLVAAGWAAGPAAPSERLVNMDMNKHAHANGTLLSKPTSYNC